jgi:hypothetical protein
MKPIVFLLIVLPVAISSCKPLSNSRQRAEPKTAKTKIAFAVFSVYKSANLACIINLTELKSREGHLKANPVNPLLYPVDVSIEDSTHNRIDSFQIEHPLIENYEYADDQGKLQKMIRSKDSANLYLRFNWPENAAYIHFLSENPTLPLINSIILLH